MFLDKSAYEIASAVKSGRVKAIDVAEEFLEYASKDDIGVFVSIDANNIKEAAKRVDEKRARGEELGSLAGVPFIIKDNIMVKGERLTCSSKMLGDYISVSDAVVVEKIRAADGIIFGKANLDEFAMGSSTENSALFVTKNPWNRECVPGGSSGGSAAGVAALMAPLSLGSDTGGSIRQPASFCGLFGLKPTYGRVSRRGLISFASSLDQIGPMARNVGDIALAMNVIAGYDNKDSTSAKEGTIDYTLSLNRDIAGAKIAMFRDNKLLSSIDSDVLNSYEETANMLRDLGATVDDVEMPELSHSIEAYYIIAPAEVSSNLSRFDGVRFGLSSENPTSIDEMYRDARTRGFGEEVKRRVIIGNYVLSAGHYDSYYQRAYQVRRVVKNKFDTIFKDYDAILMPTTSTKAFKFGENIDDPVKMYLSDVFTVSANLAGLPGISFPVKLSEGLPIGMQLIGKHFEDGFLISLVSALEKKIDKLEFRRIDV